MLYADLALLGVVRSNNITSKNNDPRLYDILVTDKLLRTKTEKLFKDGHHARAVEEAYKLLDNIVKKQSGQGKTGLTGAPLMNTVFSVKTPILKLNSGVTTSEKDEQVGYMQIFAGCMTGIRNPRAHETDWEDTEQRALQLIVFANHLIERTIKAEKAIFE
jgi:uncharacterized protein (TIGR02391 family)